MARQVNEETHLKRRGRGGERVEVSCCATRLDRVARTRPELSGRIDHEEVPRGEGGSVRWASRSAAEPGIRSAGPAEWPRLSWPLLPLNVDIISERTNDRESV